MRFAALFVVVVALAAVSVQAQAPIPYRPDGFTVSQGSTTSPIQFDMFLDLLCPDCAAAWPNVKDVMDYYKDQINTVIHFFPLPYHTYGFTVAQSAHVFIQATQPSYSVLRNFSDYIFTNQAQFWNSAVNTISPAQVVSNLGQLVEEGGFLTASQFNAGMADDNINENTRVSWKYACSRGVLGTPTFFVNGVNVNGDPSWTLAEWRTLLDPLLQPLPPMKVAAKKTPACKNRKHSTRTFHQVAGNCPTGEPECDYSPGKYECCYAGEMCIPNVGCRC